MSVRILAVEDDLDIASFLVRGLTEEGYVVEHAADGRHAWLRLQAETWDLVILDCQIHWKCTSKTYVASSNSSVRE